MAYVKHLQENSHLRKLWTAKGIGHRRRWNKYDLRCKSGMTQETWASETRKDDIAPRTPKGRTSRMKCWNGSECKIGIKDPDTRQQLHLKIKTTSEGFNRKPFGLVKRATRMFSRLRNVRDWTVWRSRRPPE
jgi:hypothetical protein